MPLQSLQNFTILYCGTRPNTIVPRQSRSVSPVKDSNPTSTADKLKLTTAASVKRTGSPTRSSLRSQIQSTQTSNQRRASERLEKLDANQSGVAKPGATTTSSAKSGTAAKAARQKSSTQETDTSKAKGSDRESKNVDNKQSDSSKSEDDNDKTEEKETRVSKDEKDSQNSETTRSESRSKSVVVMDTLSKTTDSLNLATNALGRLSISLNQAGMADSLLEEVRLKMTHAEAQAQAQAASASKPSSARPQTRDRENLERGN